MIRRKFLGLLTLAGASSVAALTKAGQNKDAQTTARYKVTGFTCLTCATGLESLLSREKGILSVKASYPEGTASVGYNPQQTDGTAIAALIENMGFKAQVITSA